MVSEIETTAPTLSKAQDPTSVYYLHHNDASGVQLVNTPFPGDNFGDWKRSMVIGLSARNKLSFVDGSLAKPALDSPDLKVWERNNDMIISWFLKALDPTIAKSVLYLKSAREIWLDLHERYGTTSGPQFYAAEQKLAEMSQNENESIAEFFTRIKVVWDQIDSLDLMPTCTCAGCSCSLTQKLLKVQQSQRLIHFLMKVDPKYANVKSTILMMQPLPTISQAYRLFIQEERHRELSVMTTHHEQVAFDVEQQRFSDRQIHKGYSPRPTFQNATRPVFVQQKSNVPQRFYNQGGYNNSGNESSGNHNSRLSFGNKRNSLFSVTIAKYLVTTWNDASKSMAIHRISRAIKRGGLQLQPMV
ncbi:uncharacterized protein [Spinacia oleracea]|uniref:Retrotransposon Copia-like N-terminal domain-containing protein n=1 Tax=Spinacia oleracea TaxID=3562 RepID=A0ABM3R7A8_SPIOL|nr:uncharacterized protein LOC130467013 [Spinacia oleracea]